MDGLFSNRFKRWAAIVGVTVMLACGIGPWVSPVQAAYDINDYYFAFVGFMTPEPGHICLGRKNVSMEGYVAVKARGTGTPPLAPLELIHVDVKITPTLGQVKFEGYSNPRMMTEQIVILPFTYTATQTGHEVITIEVAWNGKPADNKLEFEVKKCKRKFHGTADMGKWNSRMSADNPWNIVGTYDISGTVVIDKDSIKGEAIASFFLDEMFEGSKDGVTCTHSPPWQGASGGEMEGDLAAWQESDTLDLKLSLQPLALNGTTVSCKSDDGEGGGSIQMPPMTIASFDLDFAPVPADGGSTSLEFKFPNGTESLDIELTVSEEAES